MKKNGRGEGKQPELIIRRAKIYRAFPWDAARFSYARFPSFHPCSPPVDRVGVVLTTQYYHYTKLARTPRYHGRVDAQRVKRDKKPNGSRSPRRSGAQKYDEKITVDDGRGATEISDGTP